MGASAFYIDPRSRPPLSDTGQPTTAVNSQTARMLWIQLMEEGALMHSEAGATVWAMELLCKRLGHPYKVLQAQDAAGSVLGLCFQLADVDVQREAPGITVLELRSWRPLP